MIRPILIAAALWLACTPIPGPVPVPPIDASDAATPVPDPTPAPTVDAGQPETSCATTNPTALACCVLRGFHCPEGNDTPKGETCLSVYGDRAAFPGLAAITAKETKCLSAAKTLAAVRACGVKCAGGK